MNDNSENIVDNANLWAENQRLQSNWNSLRELLINEKKLIEEDEFFCNTSVFFCTAKVQGYH